eukprot:scaffold13750_cov93-Skeletonema_marinoi.AAC.3
MWFGLFKNSVTSCPPSGLRSLLTDSGWFAGEKEKRGGGFVSDANGFVSDANGFVSDFNGFVSVANGFVSDR